MAAPKKPVRLYWFASRNTAVAAPSAKVARQGKRRGGDKIVKVRTPTLAERKAMRSGRWVRTRKDGKSPAKSRYGKGRGQGPKRKRS